MSNLLKHPYHLVNDSPWPLFSSLGAFCLTAGLVEMFFNKSLTLLISGITIVILVSAQWWKDISLEGTLQGLHSNVVQTGLRWGMVLFIISEVMFFFSFFWAFFHSSISPSNYLGMNWPPLGVIPFNPFQIPLLNTIILLSSGLSVTWSHHSIMEGNHSQAVFSLFFTIFLGIYFTLIQGYEYLEASFNISDSVFGSSFFLLTGFHGLHVLVGTTFLIVCLIRLMKSHFSPSHHFGFEAAAWYWHFVDVVWLFLFVSVYWWGG